jgi:hypothetical protein
MRTSTSWQSLHDDTRSNGKYTGALHILDVIHIYVDACYLPVLAALSGSEGARADVRGRTR